MIKGLGVDIIEIDRIKSAVEKYGVSFLNKVYTTQEINYCRNHKIIKYPELAVRFAAKEAYAKALGTGIGQWDEKKRQTLWKDIEVINDQRGKPQIYLKGELLRKVKISLSHSRDCAVAMVVIEK
ncbi:holo-ACP synthase [Candidatus Saganbacteria bacterium]|nr:holo-ACP synthase [Candidatus Saganbacteria bacterium]